MTEPCPHMSIYQCLCQPRRFVGDGQDFKSLCQPRRCVGDDQGCQFVSCDGVLVMINVVNV